MEEQNKLVPDMNMKPVIIDDDIKTRIEEWVRFLKNISPRILVASVLDELFAATRSRLMEKIRLFLADGDPNTKITFTNFTESDICLFACVNSAIDPQKEAKYEIKDMYVFCFNDKAVGIHYGFERDEDDTSRLDQDLEENWHITYTYVADYHSWEDRVGTLVKIYADVFERKVPALKKE